GFVRDDGMQFLPGVTIGEPYRDLVRKSLRRESYRSKADDEHRRKQMGFPDRLGSRSRQEWVGRERSRPSGAKGVRSHWTLVIGIHPLGLGWTILEGGVGHRNALAVDLARITSTLSRAQAIWIKGVLFPPFWNAVFTSTE